MKRVILASWWDTLKSVKYINYLILSNKKSLSNKMYGLMGSIITSRCWMFPLDCYRIITLMLFLTLVFLFHFPFVRLEKQNMFLFWVDHWSPSWLVHRYLFWLVHPLFRMNLFWFVIDLLLWNRVHPFLVYPNRLFLGSKYVIFSTM